MAGFSLPGSPPLTRGKERQSLALPLEKGITPAYAGKRSIWRRSAAVRQDHPRLRGEKLRSSVGSSPSSGSPPLTRGKAILHINRVVNIGITPAYAGKSPVLHPQDVSVQDHPRLRGEKYPLGGNGDDLTGSPPLTRGKASRSRTGRQAVRITPAYAGKSAAI